MRKPIGLAVALLSATAFFACATEPKQSPNTPSITTITSFPPDLGRGAPRLESTVTMLYTPIELRHRCAGVDPQFAFDSAKIDALDTKSLRSLADCMKTGPLAGKTIRVVGHADARGSAMYNERLGFERAEAVKEFLMKTGIDADRIQADSRGKLDAEPRPADWDRRVDFELVP